MSEYLNYVLFTIGSDYLNIPTTSFFYPVARLILLITAVLAVHWFVTHLVTPGLRKVAEKILISLFAYFIKHKVFLNILRMVPVGLLGYFSFVIGHDVLEDLVNKSTSLLFILNGVMLAFSIFNALYDHYDNRGVTRRIPLKAFFQFIKMISLCVAVIFVASILMNKSPTILLSSLGALSAILLITFRDPIYQLSCGVAVTSQRLCAIGDWVSIPKSGVDGEIISMGMTTCQVQQWDRSIVSVNMSELMSGMVNWQNIYSKGRRIKRNFMIDLDSVRFINVDDIETTFSQVELLEPYLQEKLSEITTPDSSMDFDTGINKRRLTNIGTFRAYVQAYLHSHPMIDGDSTILVRLLESTSQGIPLQIYCFSHAKDSGWITHEGISSDIADWILASVSKFNLRLYQSPGQHIFQNNNDAPPYPNQ